jgi:ABC-2 type transport system permease protein
MTAPGGNAWTVLGTKWTMLDNVARQIRSHLLIHFLVGLAVMGAIIVGGGAFFHLLFGFLLRQEPFGPPLLERLVGIVLLAFFFMLVFSNLIITLTTTYISRETEFLMALPLRARHLFGVKLGESMFYSSWAFALLCIPLFAAYGAAKGAPLWFYPWASFMALPFVVIPAALGATLTMIASALFPARKARTFTIVLLVSALASAAIAARVMGLRSMVASSEVDDFERIMGILRAGTMPVLPNAWLANGMEAASSGRFVDSCYWLLLLTVTALASIHFALLLAPPLYPRGWALARESGAPDAPIGRSWSALAPWDWLFHRLFPRPVACLLSKDMRTFWRDPSQWSQLVVLFALLSYYFSNLPNMTRELDGLGQFLRHWPVVLGAFNLGATCFVLSILTTRFVYPMLSLEGKQFWIIGLAPFPRTLVLWEKYLLCALSCLTVALVLVVFSNIMLRADPMMNVLSMVTVPLMALGLTSLAVGLSAVFPNFREDNPARIANGLGGTANILASLSYIALNMGIQVPGALWLASRLEATRQAGIADSNAVLQWTIEAWWILVPWVLLHAFVIIVPMRIGHRRWTRMEFHI